MKIAIIGLGNIGTKHQQFLSFKNYEVFSVDPKNKKAGYKKIFDLPKNIDVFYIASPTEQHLHNIKEILQKFPQPKIIVEKPVCRKFEFNDLQDLVEKNKGLKILIRDIYDRSPVIAAYHKIISDLTQKYHIKKMHIELSKNRSSDERNGRSTDRYYGDLGYEVFHLYSLFSKLKVHPKGDVFHSNLSWNGLRFSNEIQMEGVAYHLCSSARGVLPQVPRCVQEMYENSCIRKELQKGFLGNESKTTLRFIDTKFVNARAILVLESAQGESYQNGKNIHKIYVQERGKVKIKILEENHLLSSFESEIALLQQLKAEQNLVSNSSRLFFEMHDFLLNKYKKKAPEYLC